MKIESELKHFQSRKCIWKCRLRNGVYLVSASMPVLCRLGQRLMQQEQPGMSHQFDHKCCSVASKKTSYQYHWERMVGYIKSYQWYMTPSPWNAAEHCAAFKVNGGMGAHTTIDCERSSPTSHHHYFLPNNPFLLNILGQWLLTIILSKFFNICYLV